MPSQFGRRQHDDKQSPYCAFLADQTDLSPYHESNQESRLLDYNLKAHNCDCKCKMSTNNEQVAGSTFYKKYVNIRYIGVLLFVLASCYCVYRLVNPHPGDRPPAPIKFTTQLRLISAFNRHGDRAPSDALPVGDPHTQWTQQIWPNGMSNLTDLGKFRQYKIGLELRHRYQHYLDFNSSSFLAFSSSMYRCQESLSETLRGLFSNEWPLSSGLQLAAEYSRANCSSNATCSLKSNLPAGFLWPHDYKQIPIDTQTFPMLRYEYLNRCKYRLAHPTPVDVDLSASKAIKDLPGLDKLAEVLQSKYAMRLNFTALSLWSTITNELRLIKTRDTLDWSRVHFDWVTRAIDSNKTATTTGKKKPVTLFDLHEQVAVFGYRDRIVDVARYVQLGPIVTSLVESQKTALGQSSAPGQVALTPSQMYANKKMIFYSSHDSILQLLMHGLNIIDTREDELSFEQRSNKWAAASDHEQYLAGLRMSKFGMSMLVELWEAQEVASDKQSNNNKLAYVQAYLYNREEALAGVHYARLQFGSICRRLFRKLYPNEDLDSSQFYANFGQFKLSEKFSCPFELFKNVTSKFMVSGKQLSDLCD